MSKVNKVFLIGSINGYCKLMDFKIEELLFELSLSLWVCSMKSRVFFWDRDGEVLFLVFEFIYSVIL